MLANMAVTLPHAPLVTEDGKIKTTPFSQLDTRTITHKKVTRKSQESSSGTMANPLGKLGSRLPITLLGKMSVSSRRLFHRSSLEDKADLKRAALSVTSVNTLKPDEPSVQKIQHLWVQLKDGQDLVRANEGRSDTDCYYSTYSLFTLTFQLKAPSYRELL